MATFSTICKCTKTVNIPNDVLLSALHKKKGKFRINDSIRALMIRIIVLKNNLSSLILRASILIKFLSLTSSTSP